MDFKDYLNEDYSWYSKPSYLKPWKAKRADAINMWTRLKDNLPINLRPIPKSHRGSTFRTDGIRITGSPPFIQSILSRIKDFLQYDKKLGTKLEIEYRQIPNKKPKLGQEFVPESPEYVFYIHVKEDK